MYIYTSTVLLMPFLRMSWTSISMSIFQQDHRVTEETISKSPSPFIVEPETLKFHGLNIWIIGIYR